jgi:hypothetical protein
MKFSLLLSTLRVCPRLRKGNKIRQSGKFVMIAAVLVTTLSNPVETPQRGPATDGGQVVVVATENVTGLTMADAVRRSGIWPPHKPV